MKDEALSRLTFRWLAVVALVFLVAGVLWFYQTHDLSGFCDDPVMKWDKTCIYGGWFSAKP